MVDSRVPYLAPLADFVVSVTAGGSHSLVLGRTGQRVWGRGSNSHGQLGRGDVGGSALLPTATNVKYAGDIAAGSLHSLAASKDKFVSWGGNISGALGDNTPETGRGSAAEVAGMEKSHRMSAGSWFSMSLASGVVRGCGMNADGQLGIGAPQGTAPPYYASPPVKTIVKSIVDVSAGAYHVLMLDKYREVWGCGNNYLGQLGTGTFGAGTHIPTRVKLKQRIVSIGAGAFHSLAVDAQGHVWTWGDNLWGQLGDGTNADRNLPVMVQGVGGIAYN